MGKIVFGIAIGFFLSLPLALLGPKRNPWFYLLGCVASAAVGGGIAAFYYEADYFFSAMISAFVVLAPSYIAFSLYYLLGMKMKGWSFLLSLPPTLGPWMILLAVVNFKANDPVIFGLGIALCFLDVLGLAIYLYKLFETVKPLKPEP